MLYVWRSKLLKQYGDGHIIVSAENVTVARNIAVGLFEAWYSERYYYYDMNEPDDREHKLTQRLQLHEDITADPERIKGVYINGSD